MRVIFLGTPEFAVPTLQAIVAAGHQVAGVFTQPDRPKGRGHQVTQSPIKQTAIALSLPVFQPERIRRPDSFAELQSLSADVMVVVGYGQIIPQSIIDLLKHGILNVHASLLPKYRGAAPIQWAVANGEDITGVTIMQIDAGLDTGDMLRKAKVQIGADETAPELSVRLSALGADLLIQVLGELTTGPILRERQNPEEASYAPILTKEDGKVDWSLSATKIYNRLRGFKPWPGIYTSFRDQPVQLVAAKPWGKAEGEPSELFTDKRRLFVNCGADSSLELLELRPAGKKSMTAEAFLNGYKLTGRERMGDPR